MYGNDVKCGIPHSITGFYMNGYKDYIYFNRFLYHVFTNLLSDRKAFFPYYEYDFFCITINYTVKTALV